MSSQVYQHEPSECVSSLLGRKQTPTVWSQAPGYLRRTVPGLQDSAMLRAHARPKTTRSRSELAPRRLAPCTEAQAASPQAYRPGTTWSWPFTCLRTCGKGRGVADVRAQPAREHWVSQGPSARTALSPSARDTPLPMLRGQNCPDGSTWDFTATSSSYQKAHPPLSRCGLKEESM